MDGVNSIGSLKTQSVEGDPMVWPHQRDMILYTRQVTIIMICLLYAFFLTFFSDFKTCFGFLSGKIAGTFTITLRFLTSRQHVFRLWLHDPMVWPHPRDMILYTKSSYYYNNMFIVYLFPELILFYKLFLSLFP